MFATAQENRSDTPEDKLARGMDDVMPAGDSVGAQGMACPAGTLTRRRARSDERYLTEGRAGSPLPAARPPRSDGTFVAWGDNSFGQASPPPDLVNVFFRLKK